MGASELGLSVSGNEAIDRASGALAEAEAQMPAKIRKEIFTVAEHLAFIARRRALEEPTHGSKHTGLRKEIAGGVSVEETDGGVRITTSMPQHDEAAIPRGMDATARGWRHPVWGNRHNWVVQHGGFSWFIDSMQSGRSDGEQNLERMLEEAADKIQHAAA